MRLFNYTWKRKEDNKIITIITVGSSYKDEYAVTFKDEEGESITISEKRFLKDFERVIIDYQDYKDQIAELCNLNQDFAKLGNIVARRLDPDYFTEGSYVYFDNQSHFYFTTNNRYEVERLGPEYPYKIVSIDNRNSKGIDMFKYYEKCRPHFIINLVKKGKVLKDREFDYSIPMFLDRLEPNDAYWLLRRYDKPY